MLAGQAFEAWGISTIQGIVKSYATAGEPQSRQK
jgi:hypothetical protein